MDLQMTAVATHPCQLKRTFRSCGAQAIGLCQYCNRLFCAEHGELLGDHQEVCSRRFCQDKRRDLIKHAEYKEIVLARNEERSCGIDGCTNAIGGRCSRCDGYFCGRHVDSKEEMYLQNRVRMRRMASLCHHCWARRPIWVRT